MFAVGLDFLEISPTRMKFQNWWIYNLQSLHPFWKKKIQSDLSAHFFFSDTVWETLLKAYNLTIFSPTPRLRSFAEDYHRHFKNNISTREVEKVFDHFYHLGIYKIGQLKQLPPPQIYKAFGANWFDFFKGVLDPKKSTWKWTSFTAPKILKAQIDPEYALNNSFCLAEEVHNQIQAWANESSLIFFDKIQIQLSTFDSLSDRSIEMEFPQRTCLQKDLTWIKRSIQEKFLRLELLSPITRIYISIECSTPRGGVQLSLFHNRMLSHQLANLCSKLKSHGYSVFVPKITNSHVPEKSWERIEPCLNFEIKEEAFLRPLIQYPPIPIHFPLSRLRLTEKIQWVDEKGDLHRRTYFICRSSKKWKWIFQDENGHWFEQGILE